MLLPAVIVVLLCCLAAAHLVAVRLQLQDAAAIAARTLARGESESLASSRVTRLVAGAAVTRADRGDLACVTASVDSLLGPVLGSIRVEARACALAGAE